jgi:hypothetical protein
VPASQNIDATQSALEAQLVLQPVLLHSRPPPQVMGAGVDPQDPALQVPGPTKVCPLQLPQVRDACGAPLGTAEQVPSWPDTSQAMQVPVQSELQQ